MSKQQTMTKPIVTDAEMPVGMPYRAANFQVDNLLNFLNTIQVPTDLQAFAKTAGIEVSSDFARIVLSQRTSLGAFVDLDDLSTFDEIQPQLVKKLLVAATHAIVVPRTRSDSSAPSRGCVVPGFEQPACASFPISFADLSTLPKLEALVVDKRARLTADKAPLLVDIARLRARLAGLTDPMSIEAVEARIESAQAAVDAIDRELAELDDPDPRKVFKLTIRNFRTWIARLRKERDALLDAGMIRDASIKEAQAQTFEDAVDAAVEEFRASGLGGA